MAYAKLRLRDPVSERTRTVRVGFSWPILALSFVLLPMLVPLFKRDWRNFGLMTVFEVLTLGLAGLVYAFIYNRIRRNQLLNNGFEIDGVDGISEEVLFKRLGLGSSNSGNKLELDYPTETSTSSDEEPPSFRILDEESWLLTKVVLSGMLIAVIGSLIYDTFFDRTEELVVLKEVDYDQYLVELKDFDPERYYKEIRANHPNRFKSEQDDYLRFLKGRDRDRYYVELYRLDHERYVEEMKPYVWEGYRTGFQAMYSKVRCGELTRVDQLIDQVAHERIEAGLTVRGSATFSYEDQRYAVSPDGCTWTYKSSFKASNVFGAVAEREFTMKVKFDPEYKNKQSETFTFKVLLFEVI